MEKAGPGEQFLHSKDSKLHTNEYVELEQTHLARTNQETSSKPAEKIASWMRVLERTHGHHEDPRVLERIKAVYHREHVIESEDIPEAAYELEARIARELGHGDIPITDEFREQKSKEIIGNQEASLDRWVDYLASEDAMYPTWAKYWVLTSVVKMGKFEKSEEVDEHSGEVREFARFTKRQTDTVAPFPPLNPRAVALVISAIESKASQRGLPKSERHTENISSKLDEQEFKGLLDTESFSRLYAQFLVELPEYSAEGLRETRGEWVKFDRGSDPQPLVDSLEGHPLEWCTAGIDTARTQLHGGDFYVYYSLDQAGEPTIPRVAIRMAGDKIAEVRGIAHDQHLDPYISEVVSEKMTEFPDGEAYQRRAADMKRLTDLEETIKSGAEPAMEDLRFLYEIDRQIEGFGYHDDPRVKELISLRKDELEDISRILDIPPSRISTTDEEALYTTEESRMEYHYGSINLGSHPRAEGIVLPRVVRGSVDLGSLKSAKDLVMPDHIGENLLLYGLESTDGLKLPQSVNGLLRFDSLKTAEGLTLPRRVGSLSLIGMTNAKELNLPEEITGSLILGDLTSAEGLGVIPDVRECDLGGIKSAKGLMLPSRFSGDLYLGGLISADGLLLPESVGGDLELRGIQSPKGLVLPKSVGRTLDLSGLRTAEGLVLPESVGNLDLEGLETLAGLELPPNVIGSIRCSKDLYWAMRERFPEHFDKMYVADSAEADYFIDDY